MKSQMVFLIACALAISVVLGACTTSSELGEEEQTQSAFVQADTSTIIVPAATLSETAATDKQGFTTKEDTIEVESAQKKRHSEHTPVTVQKQTSTPQTSSSFGIQIGAFKTEANAQQALALLGKRYSEPAVVVFDEPLKLYKVVIGTFATQQEAVRFCAAMKKKFPAEYGFAWVTWRTE